MNRTGWRRARQVGLHLARQHAMVALVVPVVLSGCAFFNSGGDWQPRENLTEALCFAADESPPARRSPTAPPDVGSSFGLSGRPAVVAEALGLFPLLHRRRALLQDGEPASPGDAWRLIRIERRLASRLKLATLQVTALSARIGCEGNRAREFADSVARNKNRREDRRTIGAILAGAATNVLTGLFSILDMAVTGGGIGIAGGVTQYGLRGAVEEVDISVDFRHQPNFLHDLWEAPAEPELFPPAVWRFLTYHAADRASLRDQTVDQWKLGRNITDDQSDDFKERYGVLFDAGGTYNIAQLRARAAMLDLLRSSVELMHADLALLVERLELEDERSDR